MKLVSPVTVIFVVSDSTRMDSQQKIATASSVNAQHERYALPTAPYPN